MRLVSLYLPLSLTSDLPDSEWSEEDPTRGTLAYFLRCIGGRRGVAQLYLEAGLLCIPVALCVTAVKID